jgi:photosystem II stability/assembly factor-like uncharacterized protein
MPTLRSAVKRQIHVGKAESRLLLALLSVALVSGSLAAVLPVSAPAVTPTIASDAERSIAEIRMLDATNGWAWSNGVEGQYLLLRTTDGGQTWNDVTPRAFPFSEFGGWFLDAQTAWVSTLDRKTYSGGLLRTTDGGKSWTVLVKEGAAPFKCLTAEGSSCEFLNANHAVARTADYGAGSAYVRFFETQDGGMTWSPVIITTSYAEPNLPPGTIHLSNISGGGIGYYPPVKVIITDGDLADEQPKGAVRLSLSLNLGKSWRDLRLPVPDKYRDGLTDPSPVFFDGENGLLPVRILKRNADNSFAYNVLVFYSTHDGGITWTARPGIVEHARNYHVVSLKDVFVRGGANLYVTHDGARSWRAIKPSIDFGNEGSKRDVSRMDFVDATHGWVLVYDNVNDSPYGHHSLYRTSDGGTTWTELPLKIVP